VCCSVLEGRRTLCRMRFILSISTCILLQYVAVCCIVCCSVLQLSRDARNATQHGLLCPSTPVTACSVCGSVLQRVAVCCSVLQQHVAAACCSSVLRQCVAAAYCGIVLQQRAAAACCSSVLQCVTVCYTGRERCTTRTILSINACSVCYSVLQCIAVC